MIVIVVHVTDTVWPPLEYGWKISPNVPPIEPLLGAKEMLSPGTILPN